MISNPQLHFFVTYIVNIIFLKIIVEFLVNKSKNLLNLPFQWMVII